MRFRTAVIWNGISQLGQSGITLLSTIILARMLTPDDFGVIGIVTIFIAFSQIVVDSEMGGALLRKKEVNTVDYSTLFYYNLAVSIAIYLILYVSAPWVSDYYGRYELKDIIRVISITIIIHSFRVVQRIMIFRALKFRLYAWINILSGLVSLGVAIWLAKRGFGYWALVWQQVALAACHVIGLECYNRFLPVLRFSKASFKYQFSFGISLLGSDVVRVVATNLSTNIIAKISTLQFTGYFTQSSRLSNFCQSTATSIMDQSVFPLLAKKEDIGEVKTWYNKCMWLAFFALGVITACMYFFAEEIIILMLGKEWIAATPLLQILSLTIIPTTLPALCRNILKVTGSTKKILKLESVKSVITIVFMFGFIPFGQEWVVWSLVFSQTIGCAVWMLYTHRELKTVKTIKR